MKPIGAIVAAAGTGTRFGTQGKALVMLEKVPLIVWVCRAFLAAKINHIWITALPDQIEEIKSVLAKESIHATVLSGGKTRQESVKIAFDACKHLVQAVLVHDVARPMASKDLIRQILLKGKTEQAVIPVLPLSDTLKRIRHGYVEKTLSREALYTVQTPQFFDIHTLEKSYQEPIDTLATDEATLVENRGIPVATIPGDWTNLKITYPEDLIRAQQYLLLQQL